MMKKVLYLSFVNWLVCLSPVFAQINPKTLLIYYSYPSLINGVSTTNAAAAQFGQYDYVVLGDGLEFGTHDDHMETQLIVNHPSTDKTLFFGYVDLGVSTQNLSSSAIQTQIDLWKTTGVDGIFFDVYGYDYGVSRVRQNEAVAYAHAQGLPIVANAWNPDDVFGRLVNPEFNPLGAAPVLNENDYYLSESYLIQEGTYGNQANWKSKADKLKSYQTILPFHILSITTNAMTNEYDQAKFWYAWHGAFLYGHTATGWGEFEFSTSTSEAIFRTRPDILPPGKRFLIDIQASDNEAYRYTNTGKIWIKTDINTYGFTTSTICQSTTSGRWTDAATWSCGRVPFPCDQVLVKLPHTVMINTPVDVAQIILDGKIRYTNTGALRIWP